MANDRRRDRRGLCRDEAWCRTAAFPVERWEERPIRIEPRSVSGSSLSSWACVSAWVTRSALPRSDPCGQTREKRKGLIPGLLSVATFSNLSDISRLEKGPALCTHHNRLRRRRAISLQTI